MSDEWGAGKEERNCRVRVKVCGITNYEDAARALDLGADALGFNFHEPSPRHVAPEAARDIIRRLPPLALMAGVFVNVADPRRVEAMAHTAGIQVLQLHGDETAEYCALLSDWPVIKAVRMGAGPVDTDLQNFPARAFLLDAQDDRRFGGTGRAIDWQWARQAAAGARIILAGGLHPGNVGEAIRTVRPYAVDVCSGVESAPGRKDAARLAAFMDGVFHASR